MEFIIKFAFQFHPFSIQPIYRGSMLSHFQILFNNRPERISIFLFVLLEISDIYSRIWEVYLIKTERFGGLPGRTKCK